jgi:ATP-dependent DNA helicase RecG
MAIEVVDITEEQADHLVALEEGHFLDLKAIEVAPGRLTKSMSPYANSDGGELFVGIAEHKPTGTVTWSGFPTQEDANGHLQAFEDQLRRTKGATSFESETVADARTEEITNSEAIMEFMLEVIPDREPEHWLRQQHLLVGEKPTVGGLILFSDEPQVHLPKGDVKPMR